MSKKVLLIILAQLLCSTQFIFSQTNIFVNAPIANNGGSGTLPEGYPNAPFRKGCFLITQSELGQLLSNDITSFGFQVYGGSNVAVGNFTVYLQNTSDLTYSKGTSYSTAISSMANVYAGVYTIPANNGTVNTITFNFPSNFNYTGGGLYVAFTWSATSTTNSASYATYFGNGTNSTGYKGGYSSGSGANAILQLSTIRPACIFGAINNATNELELVNVLAPAKVAEILHSPHTITADIRNNSINPATNISVLLDIAGANTFTDTQVISSLAPGSATTVTFASFDPIVSGNNLISVSLPSDQYMANNQIDLNQIVTCNFARNWSPAPTFTQSIGFGNFPGACLSKFNFNKDANLTGVKLSIAADYSSLNAEVYGIIMDESGVVLGTTNTITPSQGIFNSVQSFSFSSPTYMFAGSDYYIGMAESTGFFMAANETSVVSGFYYYSNIDGTNIELDDTYYYGIEPILDGTDIKITQSSTVMCNGESKLLMATGATNYTWTCSVFNPITNPNDPSIEVSPTSNEMYTLTAIDDAGCSAILNTPLAVKACVGLSESKNLSGLEIYPNPTVNGLTTVKGLQGENLITVYNALGEIILNQKNNQNQIVIDLTEKSKGTYLIKIQNANKDFKIMKVIN